ncbi:MAG: DNA replication and repair protein RecF, partial [Myxococcota bacterium]
MGSPTQCIERVRAVGWRNLGNLDWTPGRHFNVVHGDNGSGKSNLLEAIYYLGALRSFRGAKTDDIVCRDSERCAALAQVRIGAAPVSELRAELRRVGSRKITVDGKRPRSTGQWLAAVQMVVFHPGHLALVGGSPEGRRSFLDSILEHTDASYRSITTGYQKALRSRNHLLKHQDVERSSIRAFDAILAQHGAIIGERRTLVAKELESHASPVFRDVVGKEQGLRIVYTPTHEPTAAVLEQALSSSFDKDRRSGRTNVGPHTDDMRIEFGPRLAKHYASQGQQRTAALSMKVAELHVLSDKVGSVPVLLMDDISSELD